MLNDPFGDGVRAADYDCVLNRIHYLTVVYQSREVDLSLHSGVLEGRRQQSGRGVEGSDLTGARRRTTTNRR